MPESPDDIVVLYVDDDADYRTRVAESLGADVGGFRVLSASSAAEALSVLDGADVDCVVSEYAMSGDDGLDFLRSVRTTRPDLPFVLYTADGDESVASDAIEAGVDGYLRKGEGLDRLADRLADLASTRANAEGTDGDPARLAALVENVSDAIVVVGADGVVQFANGGVERVLGYDPADLAGERLTTLVPPSLRERHREAFERYLEIGERTLLWNDIRFPVLHADGHQVSASVSFGEFDSGGTAAFVGVIRDVDESGGESSVLDESGRQFREIVENLHEVVWLEDPQTGEVLYVNPAFEDVWGRPRESLYGSTDAFMETIHPSDRARVEAAHDRYDEESVEVEYRVVRPDGDVVWVRDRTVPITEDGETRRIVGISEDVTQMRTLEDNLRASQAALADLYRVSSDRESDFEDKLQRLLEAGCEYLDLSLGFLTRIDDGVQHVVEAVGDHPELQPGASCPLSEAYCRRTIDSIGLLGVADAVEEGWEGDPAYERFELGSYLGGKVVVDSVDADSADDELYGTLCFADTESRDSPFTDSERTFVELLTRWVSYELERERADERLQSKIDRLEQFASVVSHDIRNPLTTAHGYLELVEDGQTEYVEEIDRALTRMDQMTADLLDLAREGEPIGETEPVGVHALARETWDLYHSTRSDAELVVADEVTVSADRSALSRLLANLFKNAVEHVGADVTVTVGRLDDGGFYVADDGPGIPEEMRDTVFEQGYTDDDGTGLGLAIVRELAAAHGWDVDLTASADGGARFEFRVE